jgi:hypothetical protein
VLALQLLALIDRARAPGLELAVPITKAPDDAWVQNACCQAIANLGYVVQTSGGRIRIEVDAKNPWPWPDEGAPAPAAAGAIGDD